MAYPSATGTDLGDRHTAVIEVDPVAARFDVTRKRPEALGAGLQVNVREGAAEGEWRGFVFDDIAPCWCAMAETTTATIGRNRYRGTLEHLDGDQGTNRSGEQQCVRRPFHARTLHATAPCSL